MKKLLRGALLLMVILLLGAAVFHTPLLRYLGHYLVLADAPHKADAALVLGGDGWGHRIVTGAQLARDGYVPKVLVSGPDGAYGNHECDLAIPFAMKQGYPEAYFVHMEHNARSTQAEAELMIPQMRQMGIHSLVVVTSNFHTRRAGGLFRKMAPDMTIYTAAAPDENFDPDDWWHSREGQKTFLYEWEKTVAGWFGI